MLLTVLTCPPLTEGSSQSVSVVLGIFAMKVFLQNCKLCTENDQHKKTTDLVRVGAKLGRKGAENFQGPGIVNSLGNF